MDPIVESEMTFGPYPNGHCFRIENSNLHKVAGEGVKIVEFLKLRLVTGKPAQIWLVEAKKSAPKADQPAFDNFIQKIRADGHVRFPDAKDTVNSYVNYVRDEGRLAFPKLPNDFDDYINDIREKMENGLTLYFSSRLKRHPVNEDEWPQPFLDLDLAKTEFRLLLVIKTATDAWLPPLNDKLKKALQPIVKTWALGPTAVEVLTEAGARKYGLIH